MLVLFATACSASKGTAEPRHTSTTTVVPNSTTVPGPIGDPCGSSAAPPTTYESVVVFSFENRSWDEVGPGFGPTMPYLHELGTECSWFPDWTEVDEHQKSLSQYVGQLIGEQEPAVADDCKPSATCSTTADNLFRQLRTSGRRAVDYVEGATTPCSADGNAAKHIPPLYFWGADDRAHCTDEVRPLTDLDPNHLPAFSFVTPTLCHDGHDCSNQTVDGWARGHVQPVLDIVGVPGRQGRGLHLVRRERPGAEPLDHADGSGGCAPRPRGRIGGHPARLGVDARGALPRGRLHRTGHAHGLELLSRPVYLTHRRGVSGRSPRR